MKQPPELTVAQRHQIEEARKHVEANRSAIEQAANSVAATQAAGISEMLATHDLGLTHAATAAQDSLHSNGVGLAKAATEAFAASDHGLSPVVLAAQMAFAETGGFAGAKAAAEALATYDLGVAAMAKNMTGPLAVLQEQISRTVAAVYTPQFAGLQASINAVVDSLIAPAVFAQEVLANLATANVLEILRFPNYLDGVDAPPFLDGLRLSGFLEQAAQIKLEAFSGLTTIAEQAAKWFHPTWSEQVLQMLQGLPADWWTPERGLPANWPESRLEDTAELAVRKGLMLVGFPSAQVIVELLDAEQRGEDVNAVLAMHQDEIIEELLLFANGLDHTTVDTGAAVLTFRELLDNFCAGRCRTIQASAFSIIEDLYRLVTGAVKVEARQVRRHRVEDVGRIDYGELTKSIVLHSMAWCYDAWYPGQAALPQLNRQMSAHTVSQTQHTPDNALRALMLVAGLLYLHVELVPV